MKGGRCKSTLNECRAVQSCKLSYKSVLQLGRRCRLLCCLVLYMQAYCTHCVTYQHAFDDPNMHLQTVWDETSSSNRAPHTQVACAPQAQHARPKDLLWLPARGPAQALASHYGFATGAAAAAGRWGTPA